MEHTGKYQKPIGDTLRGKLRQLAEHIGEDHHREERPDYRPGRAYHSLLVANRNVAPSQHAK